ncbi:hypothetical protein SADUNF_Sadunf08G0030000 [Salix dunnii]|uniref:UBC core domain-containing protein n=1 Tax=Salix dunnii TaxID=1413687 RepID=A0A835JX54_9ROSI|nr:hypothetical protein SADUNF_Sadunf08G0030000 [Salix dunnii]
MEVRPNQTVDDSPQHRRHGPATPSKQPVAPSNKVDTTSATEGMMSLMMIGGDLGVSAFPEGESIFAWIGTNMGGKGTAYEGLSYKLSLCFPPDYPFKPPQVKFETMCFHPNVDQFGNICLDILQFKASLPSFLLKEFSYVPYIESCYFSRVTNEVLSTCLRRINGLQRMIAEPFSYPFKVFWEVCSQLCMCLNFINFFHAEPNPDSPLNNYAAKLWNNKEAYKSMVHRQYYAGEVSES